MQIKSILHALNSTSSENNNSISHFFLHSFFTINSIIKYSGVVVGASGLIIAMLAAFASESNNKKVKTIQPSTNNTAATESPSSAVVEEKSELEKERY